jgi:TolB protein
MELRRLAALLAAMWAAPALAPQTAAGKVYLDINAPSSRQLPVAVPLPVALDQRSVDPALAEEIREALAGDLEFSGAFRVLRPQQYQGLEKDTAGITLGSFDFGVWAELTTAEALAKAGFVKRDDGKVEIEFHVFDVVRRQEMGAPGKRLMGTPGQVREMAHRFADFLAREVTGEEGIFTTRILYVSDGGRGKEVRVMDYDGYNSRPVTVNGSINLFPEWWPDGKGLIFTSYKDGSPNLYSLSLRGGETRLTRGAGADAGAALSPDGAILALMHAENGNPDIYLADPGNGKLISRLTTLPSVESSPSWSPDGKRIAFVSDRYGSPQICVMSADGSDQHRLTFEGTYNTSPAWSPRGDLIAFASMRAGRHSIWLVNPDTMESRPLVEEGNNIDPCWSPDGRFLAFSSDRERGVYQIFVVPRYGNRAETRITSGAGNKVSPAWSPRLR